MYFKGGHVFPKVYMRSDNKERFLALLPPHKIHFLKVSLQWLILGTITVMGVVWAKILRCLALRDPCLRMRITLAVVFIRSLVYSMCVPERLRSESGVAPN